MKKNKGFSEEEKLILRKKLCAACERSWTKFGYRKTTIGELTKETGIATGSFYLLFENKEELFLETFLLLYTVTLTNTVYDQEEVFTFMLETISDQLFIEE